LTPPARLCPIPAPDELLYSVLARYARMAGGLSPRLAAAQLLGSAQCAAVWDLPCHLQHAARALGLGIGELIDRHTLLPYLASGFLPGQRSRLRRWMAGNHRGGSLHAASGTTASAVANTVRLRYCPQCAREDARDWSAPVWRRLHQCPGVVWCVPHARPLLQSAVVVSARSHKLEAITLQAAMHPRDPSIRVVDCGRAEAIARRTLALLTGAGPTNAQAWYRHHLAAADRCGWRTAGGRVRWARLLPEVLPRLPIPWWQHLGVRVDIEHPSHWLAALLRAPRRSAHPLLHLLTEALLLEFAEPTPAPIRARRAADPRPPTASRRVARDRKAWRGLTTRRPAAGAKALRGQAPALYARLYRHSRPWLQAWNRRHRKPPAKRLARVNWPGLDACLARQVPEHFRDLAAGPDHRRRITQTRLLRPLRTPALHPTQLAKLPRLQAALARLAETPERFLRRRIVNAVREAAADGRPAPEPWQILRSSGVRWPWSPHAHALARAAVRRYPWFEQHAQTQDVGNADQGLAAPGPSGSAAGCDRVA
jgi:hypothetical protein